MTRTSITHPLHIATLDPGPGMGRIGLTLCPGKTQAASFTGAWNRDLACDLAAIEQWGAAVVVTLVEPHELDALGVADMGVQVRAHHLDWVHLPIVDVSVPDARFEAEWLIHGEGLRARLRNGFSVLIHCKGGLGRAGTIAARLLVELGHTPAAAIAAVRKVRPGALETRAQVAHVHAQQACPPPVPSTAPEAIRDRAIGALVGLAVGDALGTTLEFTRRDTYVPLTDIVGGGPFRLAPGQWTDDTAMALALADSLIAHPALDPYDLMRRFCDWRDRGTYSCTGPCFDIGSTVSAALNRFTRTGKAIAGSIDPATAGNGSLMRLAPVAVRHWNNPQALRDVAFTQSATTHGASEAMMACALYAEQIGAAIAGGNQPSGCTDGTDMGTDVGTGTGTGSDPRPAVSSYGKLAQAIAHGSWRGKPRSAIRSSGYVIDSFEAALWSVGRTANFADAVLTAANLGGDADTTAAIAGQLAGARYGLSGIPLAWLEKLAWRERIEMVGRELFEASVR